MRVRFSELLSDLWLFSAKRPMCVTDYSVPQAVVCRGGFDISLRLDHSLRHDSHYARLDPIDRGGEYNNEGN